MTVSALFRSGIQALREALRKGGAKTIEPGAYFAGTFSGTQPNAKNPRLNDEKVYTYEYRPVDQGAANVANLLGGQTVNTATGEVSAPAPVAQPATPAPVAQPAAPAPVAQPAAQPAAPAPVAQPADQGSPWGDQPAAQPAAAAPAADPNAQVGVLLKAGLDDATIAAATGVDVATVTALRAAQG